MSSIDPVLDLGFDPDKPVSKAPYLRGLEAQLDLHHCLATPKMVGQAAAFFKGLAERDRLTSWAKAAALHDPIAYARHLLIDKIQHRIGTAQTYYVAPNMCSVLEQNAQSLPSFELRPEDVVSPSGFAYFGRPLTFHDDKGKRTTVRGVLWYQVSPDEAGLGDDKYRIAVNWFTHRDDEVKDPAQRDKLAPWVLDTVTMWPYGWGWEDIGEDARTLLTFWLIISQPIGYPQGIRPDRRLRRQADRAMPDYGDINVCYLRKRVSRDPDAWEYPEESEDSHYSHRFPVRGFWRNQWYPSEGRHKPKWIAPYIKGPADKPLIIKDTINFVNR